eukprot:COSAG04_NODE_24113_length_327_cov_0.675439_1_plen_70_part_10
MDRCAAYRRLAICAAVNSDRLGSDSPVGFLTNDVLRLVNLELKSQVGEGKAFVRFGWQDWAWAITSVMRT